MAISNKVIEKAFSQAETDLVFCWDLLADLKANVIQENDFTKRFIAFQERLATAVFRLQSLRDNIIKEEKYHVGRKKVYNEDWFKRKMRQLSGFKEGIDYVVNIAKAIGDAYAYFFYQNDLELLAEHLSHQKVINHAAGNGERGELEFVKKIKHIEGQFTLFHGITNILRYGDFSFIDLKNLKVTQIGELKTKWVDTETLETSITLFRKKPGVKSDNKPIKDSEMEKSRIGRQQLGIANFLKGRDEPNSKTSNLMDKSYADEVDILLTTSKNNKIKTVQVSAGLAFSCLKFKPLTLYNHLSNRDAKAIVNKSSDQIKDVVLKLVKIGSTHNSIILSQLLYDSRSNDKNVPGTVPLFWQEININHLKDIYFGQTALMTIFNPVHLIHEVENRGFLVESDYYKNINKEMKNKKGVVQAFDRFISYICDHLFTENFVIGTLDEIEKSSLMGTTAKIQVKPQQHVEFFRRKLKLDN